MRSPVIQDAGVSLANQPAALWQKRWAAAILVLCAVAFLATAPFAQLQLPSYFAFIPIQQSALIVNDVITAVLLLGQLALRRSRAILVLAAGYAFTAFMAGLHTLSFPGLFSPTGLLGAGPQSTAWIYMFWHGGFPLFVMAYALLKPNGQEPGEPAPASWQAPVVTMVGVFAIASVLSLLATQGQLLLPPIMQGNRYTPLMIFVVSSVWGLSLAAAVLVWLRRLLTFLDLSLVVVMVAWLCDIALSAMLNQGRFDLGFYAGRVYGLAASSVVLLALLIENALLYRQQARRASEAVGEVHHLAQSFQGMLESLPQPLLILEGGTPLYANGAFATLLGYPSPAAVLADANVLTHLAPPNQQRLLRLLDPASLTGAGAEHVVEGRRLDGTPIWLKHQVETMEWQGRRALALLPRDITDRKLAEERATRSQLQLVEAVENLPSGFFYLAPDLTVQMWNAKLLTVLPHLRPVLRVGMPYEELLRAVYSAMVDPGNSMEAWMSAWERAARAGAGPQEQQLKTGRWFELINLPTTEGGVMCFRTDITHRKLQDLEIRQSGERYRSLVENSLQGLMIVQGGKIVFCNSATSKMFAYDSPAEMIGTDAINVVHPEDRHQALLVGGSKVWDTNPRLQRYYRGVRKDNAGMWYEAHRSDTLWQGRRAMQWALVDVTQEFQLQRQLESSQRMESVGRLAGGIAHDFNNILTVISSHIDFVLEGLAKDSDLAQDAQIVQDASSKAAALTRQLLAFSRRQVLELKVVRVNEVVAGLNKMMGRLIGEDIKVRTLLDPALKPVRADVTQIEQVVMNIVVNARDAMPQGGSITIETSNQYLDEAYSRSHLEVRPGEYVMLAVTDTGVGMDHETQERIFEPFFTTKPVGQGTGLGLATVYGIVKQMSGSIFVYSEPGQGTTFKVYFPVALDLSDGDVASAVAATPARPSETILLVEDDELVRRSALRILQGAGYRVIPASSPSEAMEAVRTAQEPIHLLFSDVVMEGMSGGKLWETLRQERDLPVLFMSGYTDDAIVRYGILEGKMPFLTKPFTKQNLLEKVREALGRQP